MVDNQSTDGSRDFFDGRFPEVQFIFNEENTGFAKANNLALEKSTGEYILFLNPDTIVPEDCFKKCLSFLQSKPDAGALGVKMIDGNGNFLRESKRAFPDPKTSLYKLMGLTKLFPKSKKFARYYLGHLDENGTHEVDVLAGAFMMVPKKVLDTTGGFDEDFFMYGEDIDLSYRIQKAGFKNYYFPETTIIHFKGESTKKGSLDYVKMFYKAMSIFANKHYGGSRSGIFNFFIQTGIFLRGILSGFKRIFQKAVSLVVLDVLLILLSFVIVNKAIPVYAAEYIPKDITDYWVSSGLFVFAYLLCAFLWNVYNKGYRQSRISNSFFQAIVLTWTIIFFWKRGVRGESEIVSMAALLSFAFISLARMLLVWSGTIARDERYSKTVNVIGSEEDITALGKILNPDGKANLPLRQAGPEEKTFATRKRFFFSKKEKSRVIFCPGTYTAAEVIDRLPQISKGTLVGFFTRGCHAVISGGNTEQDFSETGD